MPNLLKVAMRGQLQMLKTVGLTAIPAYLFGAAAALGFAGEIVLIILRAAGVLATTTGNLVTIFIAVVACAVLAVIFAALTAASFARNSDKVLGSMMDSMERELDNPIRLRPRRPAPRQDPSEIIRLRRHS